MSPAETSAPGWTSRGLWSVRSRAKVVCYRDQRRQLERICRRLFGRRLQPWEYAGLAGAPDEAQVDLCASCDELYLEMGDSIDHRYRGHYYVRRLGSELVLVKAGFHIHWKHLQGKGLGLQIFRRQLDNARTLGVDRIVTTAGRRDDENGYYTWPRFGFDGPLSEPTRRSLPLGLDHVRTVLDLMECEKGRLWWKEHGGAIDVSFDVAECSRSQRVFENYVRRRLRWPKRRLENRSAISYVGSR